MLHRADKLNIDASCEHDVLLLLLLKHSPGKKSCTVKRTHTHTPIIRITRVNTASYCNAAPFIELQGVEELEKEARKR